MLSVFDSVIHNSCKKAKWLPILLKKLYFFSLTTIISTTRGKISVRNREYTSNKFKYQREKRIQISLAKEMGQRVVGGVTVGLGGVVGPAYGVAVGMEPRALAGSEVEEGRYFGKTGAAVVLFGHL